MVKGKFKRQGKFTILRDRIQLANSVPMDRRPVVEDVVCHVDLESISPVGLVSRRLVSRQTIEIRGPRRVVSIVLTKMVGPGTVPL